VGSAANHTPGGPRGRPGEPAKRHDASRRAAPEPPRLSELSPTSLFRGLEPTVRVRGERLVRFGQVEVRRGRAGGARVQVLRVVAAAPGELRVTLLLDEDAALGSYTLVVIDARGKASNGLSFEVSL
jgi:hypothetical protein